jgi:hypothetical protein
MNRIRFIKTLKDFRKEAFKREGVKKAYVELQPKLKIKIGVR